jgi:hypothetical protein
MTHAVLDGVLKLPTAKEGAYPEQTNQHHELKPFSLADFTQERLTSCWRP